MFKRIAQCIIAALLAVSALAPAHAQDTPGQSIVGTWDFRVDGTTIFRFEIEQAGDGEWLGEWQRPEVFNTDGNNFANLGGGIKSSPSMTGIEFLGKVELSFDDPRPGAVPDIFQFDLTGEDTVSMLYVGTELAPYQLVRAKEGDVIGDWDGGRIYRRNRPDLQAGEDEGPDTAPATAAPVPQRDPLEPVSRRGSSINFLKINPIEISPAAVEPAEDATVDEIASEEERPEEEASEVPATTDADEVEEAQGGPASLIGDDFLEGL